MDFALSGRKLRNRFFTQGVAIGLVYIRLSAFLQITFAKKLTARRAIYE